MTINTTTGDLEWSAELPNNDPTQVWAVVNHRTPASQGFMEIYATIPDAGNFTMCTTDALIEKNPFDGFPSRNIRLTIRRGDPISVAYSRTQSGVDEEGNPIYEITYSGDLSGLDQFQRRKARVNADGNADIFGGSIPADGNNALFIKVPDQGASRFGVIPFSDGDPVQFDGAEIDVINFKFVKDVVPIPVITLLGESTVTIDQGDLYEDAGATAVDSNGNDISNDIVVENPVDTNTPGTYTITYNVTDANGNNASQISRIVVVEDTSVPIITLLGEAIVTLEVGSSYTDAGATANDNYDGDITNTIVIVNNVDSAVVGTYTVTYNVSDANDNPAEEVTRTINVVDTRVPIITLIGEAIVTLEVGSSYTDAGATAADNYDGDITNTIVIVNNVDSAVVGTYTVTYNVSDANGNVAKEIIRTVIIESTLSIEDNTKDIVKVYPNPVKDKLFIKGLSATTKVSIYNLLGTISFNKNNIR